MYSDIEMSLRKDALIAALEFIRGRDVNSSEAVLVAGDFYEFLSQAHDETTYVLKVESAAKPEPEAAPTEKPKAKRTAKKQEPVEETTKVENEDAATDEGEGPEEAQLTNSEVTDILRKMMSKTDREVLVRVLKKFGAARASDIKPEDHRAIYDIAQAVLIEDDTEAVLKKHGI